MMYHTYGEYINMTLGYNMQVVYMLYISWIHDLENTDNTPPVCLNDPCVSYTHTYFIRNGPEYSCTGMSDEVDGL